MKILFITSTIKNDNSYYFNMIIKICDITSYIYNNDNGIISNNDNRIISNNNNTNKNQNITTTILNY